VLNFAEVDVAGQAKRPQCVDEAIGRQVLVAAVQDADRLQIVDIQMAGKAVDLLVIHAFGQAGAEKRPTEKLVVGRLERLDGGNDPLLMQIVKRNFAGKNHLLVAGFGQSRDALDGRCQHAPARIGAAPVSDIQQQGKVVDKHALGILKSRLDELLERSSSMLKGCRDRIARMNSWMESHSPPKRYVCFAQDRGLARPAATADSDDGEERQHLHEPVEGFLLSRA